MKEISLGNGFFTQVDDADYEWLAEFNWYLIENPEDGKRYVRTAINTQVHGEKRKTKTPFMHRVIMKAPKDKDVDHRDSDGLNNQRFNLRVCRPDQNAFNRKGKKNSKSGYKGVCPVSGGRFRARITVHGKQITLGTFDTVIEAALAYNRAAVKYHGDFAHLNLIQEEV